MMQDILMIKESIIYMITKKSMSTVIIHRPMMKNTITVTTMSMRSMNILMTMRKPTCRLIPKMSCTTMYMTIMKMICTLMSIITMNTVMSTRTAAMHMSTTA